MSRLSELKGELGDIKESVRGLTKRRIEVIEAIREEMKKELAKTKAAQREFLKEERKWKVDTNGTGDGSRDT